MVTSGYLASPNQTPYSDDRMEIKASHPFRTALCQTNF